MQVETATIESSTATERRARSCAESRTALTGTEVERFELVAKQRNKARPDELGQASDTLLAFAQRDVARRNRERDMRAAYAAFQGRVEDDRGWARTRRARIAVK